MEKREEWTDAEILSAEGYYHGSDHETESEKWEHVSDMMCYTDYPKRSAVAYRSKLNSYWKTKRK